MKLLTHLTQPESFIEREAWRRFQRHRRLGARTKIFLNEGPTRPLLAGVFLRVIHKLGVTYHPNRCALDGIIWDRSEILRQVERCVQDDYKRAVRR